MPIQSASCSMVTLTETQVTSSWQKRSRFLSFKCGALIFSKCHKGPRNGWNKEHIPHELSVLWAGVASSMYKGQKWMVQPKRPICTLFKFGRPNTEFGLPIKPVPNQEGGGVGTQRRNVLGTRSPATNCSGDESQGTKCSVTKRAAMDVPTKRTNKIEFKITRRLSWVSTKYRKTRRCCL